MTLLSRFFKRNSEPPSNLIGLWRQVAPETAEPVLMKFTRDGRLEYHVVEGGRVNIVKLTCRIEGSEIVSDQPSSPREERTHTHAGSLPICSSSARSRLPHRARERAIE